MQKEQLKLNWVLRQFDEPEISINLIFFPPIASVFILIDKSRNRGSILLNAYCYQKHAFSRLARTIQHSFYDQGKNSTLHYMLLLLENFLSEIENACINKIVPKVSQLRC